MNLQYSDKSKSYFRNARVHIQPLLPDRYASVLEIGCGSGATAGWLRTVKNIDRFCGIELFEGAANEARGVLDELVIGDAEKLVDSVFIYERFDLILCLDVVEHMVDPWRFVHKINRLLAPGGTIIFSIPNVRNIKVLLPLVFRDVWRYEDDGLLDRTHLRFFTRRTAIELTLSGGLFLTKCLAFMPSWRTKLGVLRMMTLGLLPGFFAITYLIAVSDKQREKSLDDTNLS
jgi:SAM-dependent methyltransferase